MMSKHDGELDTKAVVRGEDQPPNLQTLQKHPWITNISLLSLHLI